MTLRSNLLFGTGKNGVYNKMVYQVREAFEACELVRINCQGMNPSDYKKIGAKLKVSRLQNFNIFLSFLLLKTLTSSLLMDFAGPSPMCASFV